MNVVKFDKCEIKKDHREKNILERDGNGSPTKFAKSEFIAVAEFEDFNVTPQKVQWTPDGPALAEILEKLAQLEDKKYPNGLGRDMFFLHHVYPIWKKYLDKWGFKPHPQDLILTKQYGGKRYDYKE